MTGIWKHEWLGGIRTFIENKVKKVKFPGVEKKKNLIFQGI